METFSNILETGICNKNKIKYICIFCDYNTSRKSSYDRHILTLKHANCIAVAKLATKKCKKVQNNFLCEKCGKEYMDRSGLWKHRQKCDNIESEQINNNELHKQNIELQKQNIELQKQILEICKNLQPSVINNTINNTMNNNKTFNLQFFLNETCKDAMNISEFIENISLQLSDLENIGKLGYVEGVSNIIIKNLNALDVTQRPMHCTDKKREIVYVKDDDEWQKEEDDKKRIKQVISSIVSKNLQLLPDYENKYPECMNPESKKSDEYNKIIMETMGGGVNNGEKNKGKIIRKIAQKVIIEKE